MKQKLVYILGLSHVGSTLLDLIIGSHSRFIGLGEIYQIFRPEENIFNNDQYCSCGQKFFDCPFWGSVAPKLYDQQSADLHKKYKIVFEAFENMFGPKTTLVDSSKLLRPLQILLEKSEVDVKVVYIIRDVRAWTVSRLNTRKNYPDYFKRRGDYLKRLKRYYGWKVYGLQWLIPALTKFSSYFFLAWYLQNKKLKMFLRQNNVDHLTLSYDELGMAPEMIMPMLNAFLGINESKIDISIEESKSHIMVGNLKKRDPRRRTGIVYDNRWLYRSEWLRSAALFSQIIKFNNNEVYRNIRRKSIWDDSD